MHVRREKVLAVQGVSSEPVSARIPCYAGKIQGILTIQAGIGSLVPL